MIRDALFIARKDVHYVLRERQSLLWLFVMPILFFYFIGTVTSGFGDGGDRKDIIAIWSGEDPGFLAEELVRRLEANDFEVVRPSSKAEFASYSRRLTIPSRFTNSVLAGQQTQVHFAIKEAGIGQDYDMFRVARAVYTVLADLVATSVSQGIPSVESFQTLRELPRSLVVKVLPAGERQTIPTGFEQAVPGIMVMFTLLVLLTSGAVMLLIERRQGLLRRLASTPITRSSVVLGKWAGKMALGLVQIGFAALAGSLFFGMDWGPHPAAVGAVLLGWAALCASAGLLLGSLAATEGQATGIGVLATNVLAALGGCWWPIEITPQWMQRLALVLPTGWAMDALHKLISFQFAPQTIVPHLIAMLLGALLLGWAAARSFRFQ